MKIETMYFFGRKNNFPDPFGKSTLSDWEAFVEGKKLSFSIQYFDDNSFHEMKKNLVENPLIPVIVHPGSFLGMTRGECRLMWSLKRTHGVRFFLLNHINDYDDGSYACIECGDFKELLVCLEYLMKEKLYEKTMRRCMFGFPSKSSKKKRVFMPPGEWDGV